MMPPITRPYDPFMDAVPFQPLGETYWLGKMPPLGQEWEAELWAQIEAWKQEQQDRAQQGQQRL